MIYPRGWVDLVTTWADVRLAPKAGYRNMRADEDKVTADLAVLKFYQLAIPVPAASSEGSFGKAAAARVVSSLNT